MIKPRRKTLLAANVILPGLVLLAYDCPLNTGNTIQTGTGYSAQYIPNYPSAAYNYTEARFLDFTQQFVTGYHDIQYCDHSDAVYNWDAVWTTSMFRGTSWLKTNFSWGQSVVHGNGLAIGATVGVH
jgi:hypothetical protein